MAEKVDAGYKVAIDFGTTFSGFVLREKLRAGQQEADRGTRIKRFYDWPGADAFNGRRYCKSPTALFYKGDADGNYNLHSWGWQAVDDCTDALRKLARSNVHTNYLEIWSTGCGVTTFPLPPPAAVNQPQPAGQTGVLDSLDLPPSSSSSSCPPAATEPNYSFGCYVTSFKLDLFMPDPIQQPHLPGDLNTARLIVDYLRCLSNFIMDTLRNGYDNNVSRMDVEWCLTVPSIWDIQAKEKMKEYAKEAGISNFRHQTKTPAPVSIILEPEGASVYCQREVKKGVQLRKGDKMMIADVGGGTIDLVVHSKADDDPDSTIVHEDVSSYGDLGGGTFVDMAFLALLEGRIGTRFQTICWQEPGTRLRLLKWWESAKKGFDSSGNYSAALDLDSISKMLYKAWQQHEGRTITEEANYAEDFWLKDEDFRRIFDPEVNKVIQFIQMQIERPDMKVLMVVGGFSTSPYLRHRVKERFTGVVSQILFPEEPASAIAYGAMLLHLHNSVRSRLASRTYGIRTQRAWQAGDPEEPAHHNNLTGTRLCTKVFLPFVTKGQQVPCGHLVRHTLTALNYNEAILELYSSEELPTPMYITSCKHEGGFAFNIRELAATVHHRWSRMPFYKKPHAQYVKIEVQMVFGASAIEVKAVPAKQNTRKAKASHPIIFATFFAPLDR